MNIVYTARKTTLRDSFKERTEKKLKKMDRFFDDAKATIVVTSEKDRETVEITIHAAGMLFRAEKTTGDRVESLDAVVDALLRQIVRNKSKLEKRFRSQAFENFDPEAHVFEEEEAVSLVKTKTFPVKPMTAEEAVLQMNLLGHSFFLFLNADNGMVNVVYSRRDGDYGLLIPEAD